MTDGEKEEIATIALLVITHFLAFLMGYVWGIV